MDSASRQEIMDAYLCVIGTVALVLWWSRVSGRDDCGPPRAGQSEPKKKGAGGPRRAECVERSACDVWAPEARAAHGAREPAFSRSAPALTGIRNGEPGRAPSSSLRDAYVREFLLIHSAPASIGVGNGALGRAPSSARRESAPALLETSGFTRGGMLRDAVWDGGEEHAGRTPSSTRRGAYERKASLAQSAPALLETSGLTRGGMPWDGGGQRAGTAVSDRMRANTREAPATPRVTALPPACARWLFENECGVSALEERCAEKREGQERER
jgi:hypothetical protein